MFKDKLAVCSFVSFTAYREKQFILFLLYTILHTDMGILNDFSIYFIQQRGMNFDDKTYFFMFVDEIELGFVTVILKLLLFPRL